MNINGLDCVNVNLDPGVEELPYDADVDIREWISVPRMMKEQGLGPNGAQIACADMMALKVGELKQILDGYRTNYFLFDTAGQVELFAFRDSSNIIVDALGRNRSLIIFTYDPMLCRKPSGMVSQIMLGVTVSLRFSVPFVNVLTKADVLAVEDLKKIMSWSEDHVALMSAIYDEDPTAQTQINLDLLRVLEQSGTTSPVRPVSALEMAGLEDIYDAIQEVYMGGEDLTSD
jgi:hypothetical protein